jgi:polo-like kinase 1
MSRASTDLVKTDRLSKAGQMLDTVDHPQPCSSSNAGGSEVWVTKWVDYSSKYGLGYLLSNGGTGVFFIDSSKIVLSAKGHLFNYIERSSSDRQDVVSSHSLTEHPEEMQRKVTLLQHVRSYLEGDVRQKTGSEEGGVSSVYLKRWMRTRHAIWFRLSNKVLQVNFLDHTEIILSSESRLVTYANKRGERTTQPLRTAMESSDAEMSKRLKYATDILTHMLSSGTGGTKPYDAMSPMTDRQK